MSNPINSNPTSTSNLNFKNKVLQSFVERLNDEQQRAVLLPDSSSLILSTAGSGKTSTLTARIAYLISEKGVSPDEILAVTFTNKAAGEMKSRLKNFAVSHQPSWIGTFHGTCNKMLRTHAAKVGLRKDFYIIDSGEQESMIKKIVKFSFSKDLDATNIIHQINSWQEQGIRASTIAQKSIIKEIFLQYEQTCVQNNCVDFAQLISRVYEIFCEYPDVAHYYWGKFKYILVDEFQDTNDLQYRWLKKLSISEDHAKGLELLRLSPTKAVVIDEFENYLSADSTDKAPPVNAQEIRPAQNVVFAVGDDDQSLYSWRGAKVKNMDDFIVDYRPEIVKLEKNYRSDGYILQAANAVIHNNLKRQPKQLIATYDSVEKIRYYKAENDLVEAGFLAEQIMKYRRSGYKYSQMAILYRTNAQSRSIEKVFTSQSIPFLIYGGFKFFDRAEVKNAMAYFRLAINPHDNLAFSRVYNVPARALGSTSFEKLSNIAKEKNLSLYDSIAHLENKIKGKFEDFKSIVDNLGALCKTASSKGLARQVTVCIVSSGLEAHYQADKKDGVQKLENLYELISAASVFEKENINTPKQNLAVDFVALSALEPDPQSGKKDPQADAVKIMTVHTAKGLEWDVVFVSGVEEGLMPHSSNVLEEEKLSEERRLMYVAMTRAKKILYLTRAQERMFAGSTYLTEASRFLYEIPKDLLITKY